MARSFNGTTDLIDIGQPAILDITGTFSISAWAYPTGLNTLQDIFEKGYDGSSEQYLLRFNSTSVDFGTYPNLIITTTTYDGTHVFANGSWYHFCGTWDGTNYRLYVNGGLRAGPSVGANPVHAVNTHVSIGAADIGGGGAFTRFFPGSIADVALWTTGLSANEASGLSQGARPNTVRPGNLVGWWPLDGLVSPEVDLSGHANNGTLTGTARAFGPPIMEFTPRWPQFNFVAAAAFNPGWAHRNVIDGVAS
jgi:Concanavalin A-like lectin/glucanases superfamily